MESHLSYPVLAFFRSHHDNQSWLGALTAILDTSAFVIASIEGSCERQAHQTFAITRHVIVDLAQSFNCAPRKPKQDRLPPAELASLRVMLTGAGLNIREGKEADQELLELRQMYEPYVYSLANYLHIAIPPWTAKPGRADNWQTSTWGRSPGFRTDGLSKDPLDEYF